jgi:hypothetical protein
MANPASERAPAATIANFVELTNFMVSLSLSLSLCWTYPRLRRPIRLVHGSRLDSDADEREIALVPGAKAYGN